MASLFRAAVLMLVVLFGATNAHATAALTLDDDAGSVVSITDNLAGDINPLLGAITFVGNVGPNWILNVTTGITKPILGSAADPNLDLNSVNISLAAGSLIIIFGDTDFTANGTITGSIGGTTQGTIGAAFCANAGNVVGICSAPATVLGPFGPGAFSSSASGPVVPGAISLGALITHTEAGQVSSFDLHVTKVPEPAAMLLFGLGLVGLGMWGRKRLRKK